MSDTKARRIGDALYMMMGIILSLVGKFMIGGIGFSIRPLEQTEAAPAIIALVGWLILVGGCGMIAVSLIDLVVLVCQMLFVYIFKKRHYI